MRRTFRLSRLRWLLAQPLARLRLAQFRLLGVEIDLFGHKPRVGFGLSPHAASRFGACLRDDADVAIRARLLRLTADDDVAVLRSFRNYLHIAIALHLERQDAHAAIRFARLRFVLRPAGRAVGYLEID